MTDSLDFAALRAANIERCNTSFPEKLEDWSPCDWMTALAGEVGEAANLIKKMRRGDVDWDNPVGIQDIANELADVVAYADLLAARLDIDLARAVREKFNVVSERVNSNVKL